MDYEKARKKLQDKRDEVLFNPVESEIGNAFNDGVMTMFNYALCLLVKMEMGEFDKEVSE